MHSYHRWFAKIGRSGKIPLTRNQVYTGYSCEWLLCILGSFLGVLHGEPGYYMILMLGYHIFLTLLYTKNRSRKFTAGFLVYYTYKVKKKYCSLWIRLIFVTAVKSYHVILPQWKPQISSSFLRYILLMENQVTPD